jgi:predicted outer membrane repeat protein
LKYKSNQKQEGGFFIRNDILFIAISIFVLATISCASAVQINETSDCDIIGNIDVESEALNANPQDFSALSDEINTSLESKSLKLTKDYSFNPKDDEKYANGIDITIDDLTIDGQGHTINANKKARIFNIKSNNVVLKNINIINGNATSHGGAIYWEGLNGTVVNCLFKDCSSPNSGGAILFKNTAQIENTKFTGNRAYFGGGANFDEECRINNCTFEGNYAKYLGGGLYTLKQTYILDSIFANNEAGDGGGIYLESTGSIENTVFEKNNAIGYGGAITNEDHVHIKNSRFMENTGKFAGAIYFKGSGHVEKSIFCENSAETGGAISIYSNNIDITNSEFKYNAANEGSSLYINGKNIKIENITFINNQTDFEYEICTISKNTTFNNMTFHNITQPAKKNETIKNDTYKNDKRDNVAVKVKTKKKTTISAKSKKFKSKAKSKKYSVVLKSGKTPLKNKKIYLKLKGKIYLAKTNKKGKAIFKIKLSKKGRFKATLTFKGDSAYKSSKKTVYIKIK